VRIGLVCPYDLTKPGGVQTQVKDLARHLTEMGDEVLIIAPGLSGSERGLDLGKTISIPGNRSRVPISVDPRVVGLIKGAASTLDLLHVHEPLMPIVSLSALRSGIPVVATFHAAPGTLGSRFYEVMRSRLGKILGPNVRRVTAVSATAAAPLPAGLDVEVIPNGVDVAKFAPMIPRDPLRVSFLGRDEKRKGLDVLLDAWGRVIDMYPEADLEVVGADRGLEGVTWLGTVGDEEKAEILTSSAIFVAPNLGGESFGIVLVEGMAAGAAVVASDLPSFREVGGEAVRYFATGSSDDLATTIIDLLGAPAEMSKLGVAGRERAQLFDWSTVALSYREVYERALS
jgi:phosphatidyl-myo-inositol alpha-mannosyltransferase